MKKIRILVGEKQEGDIKIPIYRNVPIDNEFIKMYDVMKKILFRVGKIELALIMFLSEYTNDSNVVYNNKLTRQDFKKFVLINSNDKMNYTDGTINQAFTNLKQQSVLVSIDNISGAYWLNPAFIFKGKDFLRNKIIIEIDRQEFSKRMIEQKEQIV